LTRAAFGFSYHHTDEKKVLEKEHLFSLWVWIFLPPLLIS